MTIKIVRTRTSESKWLEPRASKIIRVGLNQFSADFGSKEVTDRFDVYLFAISIKQKHTCKLEFIQMNRKCIWVQFQFRHGEIYKPYALQHPACNRARACDRPQINCSRSAGQNFKNERIMLWLPPSLWLANA